jgi:hypothetical protein
MDLTRRRLTMIWLTAMSCSCAIFSPAAPTDLVASARGLEQTRCRHLDAEESRALLDPALIDGVEPSYVYIRSARTGDTARLRGAVLQLRPLPGATPEWVTRQLECHNVRRTLGEEEGSDNDPYYLPGVALNFGVDATGDSLRVRVETLEVADAQRVLARAKANLP